MCTEPEGAENTKNSDAKPENKKHDAFEIATLITAIVGVIVLCVYTGLTGYQAYIAKDSAQRQLRAYISATVEKYPDLDSPKLPEVTVVFKNNGQTPAYKVQGRMVFYIGGEQLAESDISQISVLLDKLPRSTTVLFPGQEFRTATVPGIGIPMSADEKIQVMMGAKILWLVGEAAYVDAFGSPRLTRVRLYMGGIDSARYHRFIWAETGNDAN